MREFKRVLVANRGEIALRVIRALNALGIESVAIYSDADASSLPVREADRAFPLKGAFGSETYLNISKIMEIARISDCDAIHPGYGFLSENASFAKSCEENSIKFIGPRSRTLTISGDKFECKKLAIENQVPVVPASKEPVGSPEEAAKIANEIGFPVLLKSAFGGGGRGIKEAKSKEETREAFESSQREAQNAFGRFQAFIEKKLVRHRHIEFQIVASDNGSQVIHLGERECSVQRRYQKLIELSPSPVVDEATRKLVAGYAIKIAKAVGYSNAGTIEFLRDSATGNYYFLEVNSRLQVEHPVTELVTGVDLVNTQIHIASRGKLPIKQEEVIFRGAAIECRINAEDSLADFVPSTGKIEYLQIPGGPGIRVDTAIFPGLEITPYYDSLLAKLIAWGLDLDQARRRMLVALEEFKIAGIESSIPFHRQVMQNKAFCLGDIHTSFVEESKVIEEVQKQRGAASLDAYAVAAFLLPKGNTLATRQADGKGSPSARRAPTLKNFANREGRFFEPL